MWRELQAWGGEGGGVQAGDFGCFRVFYRFYLPFQRLYRFVVFRYKARVQIESHLFGYRHRPCIAVIGGLFLVYRGF